MAKAIREESNDIEELEDDEAVVDGGAADLELSEDLDEEDDTEVVATKPRRAARQAPTDDSIEAHTVASRQRLREQMAQDIESFLARGGRIQVVEPGFATEPPRKPVTDYGSTPL